MSKDSPERTWQETPIYDKIPLYILAGTLYGVLWVLSKGPFFPRILPRRGIKVDDAAE